MQCLGASGSSLSYYPFIPQAADIAAREPQNLGMAGNLDKQHVAGGDCDQGDDRHGVIALCGVDGRFFATGLLPLLPIRFRSRIRPRSLVTAFGNLYLAKVWIRGMTSITLGELLTYF